MPRSFKVRRGDFWLQSDFAAPALALLERPIALYEALLDGLVQHGLTLADMKVETGSGNLGEPAVHCFFFDYTTTLQINLDRAELRCRDLMRVSKHQLDSLAVDVIGVLASLSAVPTLRTYVLARGLHGVVEGSAPIDFLSRFTQGAPSKIGPLVGSSATFYFGPETGRLASFVTLDLSAIMKDAIYLRVQASWDATTIEPSLFSKAADDYLRSVMSEIGLAIQEGL